MQMVVMSMVVDVSRAEKIYIRHHEIRKSLATDGALDSVWKLNTDLNDEGKFMFIHYFKVLKGAKIQKTNSLESNHLKRTESANKKLWIIIIGASGNHKIRKSRLLWHELLSWIYIGIRYRLQSIDEVARTNIRYCCIQVSRIAYLICRD